MTYPAVAAEVLRAAILGGEEEDVEAGWLLIGEAVGSLVMIGRMLGSLGKK